MNAKLVAVVRVRLEGSSTEELLRLWKDNDRELYSEEAFEAARSILVDRGVTPLAQEAWRGRVPVASPARSLDPVSDEFWMAWLRPLLWVGIVIAAVRCLYLMTWAAEMSRMATAFSWPTINSFTALVEAVQSVLDFVLPPVLLAGAVLGLQRLPLGRRALLVWGWAEAASCTVAIVHYAVLSAFSADTVLNWAAWASYQAIGNLTLAGYAVLVLFFISRPQIIQLFQPITTGFDLSDAKAAATRDEAQRH